LAGIKLSWAIRAPFRVELTVVLIGAGELVRAAFCVPPAPEFTTASCAADCVLTIDFGAGTNTGNSSTACGFALTDCETLVGAAALF